MHCTRPNTDRKTRTLAWPWLGRCTLLAMLLFCSGCAWFKTAETVDTNFREDPKETRIRPKREGGNHIYGGLSSEANAIERNLGY